MSNIAEQYTQRLLLPQKSQKKYHFKTLVLETLDVSINHPRRTSIPSRLTKRVMSRKTISSEEIYSRLNQFFLPLRPTVTVFAIHFKNGDHIKDIRAYFELNMNLYISR